MKIHTVLGTVEEVFVLADAKSKEIMQLLHDEILSFDPEVHIVPRPGEKSIAYGIGPKKMSEAYCYVMPQKEYVNLGFYHGIELSDPNNLLEGTGNKLRHIKVKSVEAAKLNNLLDLISEAKKNREQA